MISEASGIQQSRFDVVRLQKWIVGQYFIARCAGRKQFQQVDDTKTGMADAGPSTTLLRIEPDALKKIHNLKVVPRS